MTIETPWSFALRAPEESWEKFTQKLPPPMYNDIWAMAHPLHGRLRMDGDVKVLWQNIRALMWMLDRMRERADADFAGLLEGLEAGEVSVERMVVIGIPFVEILKIARDLDLPMIVMGTRGRSVPPEEVLFGSTAEKVLLEAAGQLPHSTKIRLGLAEFYRRTGQQAKGMEPL